MFKIFSISILCVFHTILMAQNTMMGTTDSDPEAKKLLDDLRNKYTPENGIVLDFELDIQLPEEVLERQSGKIIQKGEQFFLDMPDQSIYCNGEILWLHLKEMNEVQINDFESEDGEDAFLSPSDILDMYNSGQFAYAITNKGDEDGDWITQIEFKPLDKSSEYSKMRLTLSDGGKSVKRLKVFSKDGSKYTMLVQSLTTAESVESNSFEFNEKEFPGIFVEDLRL